MGSKNKSIHIVGAGISGLIAARVLEDHGFQPVMIEATEKWGGRVKTDIVDGFHLDRGFQVLLTAYPAVRKYIDMEALNLQKFIPGAAIFHHGKQRIIGDPLRDRSLLFTTLCSGIGSFSDKINILKLNKVLKGKTLTEIFQAEEKTTLSYLQEFGFTDQMIQHFFTPFFSGIFLEPHLDTSSRMFEFIYKMFGEGYAALPKSGIAAIPEQLAAGLSQTTFRFNTKVSAIQDGELVLTDGERIKSDYIIVATDAGALIEMVSGPPTAWNACDTLYFRSKDRAIYKPLIGLISASEALINNIFYHSSLELTANPPGELLSVTIVKNHNLSEEALLLRVQKELKDYCGIDGLTFLKRYQISRALPKLQNIQYEMAPSETQLTAGIFLAGDTLLNGSLNAAMIAGESAALGVVKSIDNALLA